MTPKLEEKFRSLPPEKELEIRLEILKEEERGLKEAITENNLASPDTREFRVSQNNIFHFLGRVGITKKRIDELKSLIETNDVDEEKERNRKLEVLRANSQTMLNRFMVVTPDFNKEFLEKLDVEDLEDVDVNGVLRAEKILLVRLDNPDRYAPDGENIHPQKLFALHPADIIPAIKALKQHIEKSSIITPQEQIERSTVVWLPENKNEFQHPDSTKTVYPPRITRLALDNRNLNSPSGCSILRGWGIDLDKDIVLINGCKVVFERITKKNRFEAILTSYDVKEILL